MTETAVDEKVANQVTVNGNNNTVIQNSGAGAKITVYAAGTGNYSSRPAPVTKWPAAFAGIVGRDKERDALRDDCQTAGARVSLWGPKGMGKTSLVRHLADLLKQNGSKSVVYVDALDKGLDAVLRVLFQIFYSSEPESYIPSPELITNTALQNTEALVFVDHLLMSRSGSSDGVTWTNDHILSLSSAAPHCTFVLISEASTLPGEAEELELEGLPLEDAVTLFGKRFQQVAKRVLTDEEGKVCQEICQKLRGRPGDIIQIAGCGLPLFDVLNRLGTGTVDDKLLASILTSGLSKAELELLLFIASAGDQPVPAGIIDEAKLAFGSLDVPAELEKFKNLGLLQSHSPRYSLPGRLASGLAAEWDLSPWRDRLLDASTDWLSKQDVSEDTEYSLGMMLHVLDDAAKRQKWPQVIRLGRLLERFIFLDRRWLAWEVLLNYVLRAAQATLDRATQGWAMHQLGSRALALGNFEPARSYLNQALKIREALHDRAGEELTRHNLDMLKQVSGQSRGNGSSKNGSRGGHPLTYGLFGLAGLVVLALAGYAILRPQSAPTPLPLVVPPVITTMPATITPSSTPTLTLTPTLTITPTETATPTWTVTPTETETPGTQAPFGAVVVGVDFLACRYGPGAPYMFYSLVALKNGDPVEVLGRADTAVGQWALVQYNPPFAVRTKLIPCWVSVNYLKMRGDISLLPEADPHRVFPLFTDPKYVPGVFPYPTVTGTSRDGNIVQVSVEGKDLVYVNESSTDRESATSPLFLVEFWVCQNGKLRLNPQPIYFKYDPSQPTADGSAQATDDGSCGQTPYGDVYLAHRDGYVGPVPFKITP